MTRGFSGKAGDAGKPLIQRCSQCQTLRHPPAPVCIECHSFDWDSVQASGRASLYSFVIMHYPEVAPFDHPNPIGLIELEEGVRWWPVWRGQRVTSCASVSPCNWNFTPLTAS